MGLGPPTGALYLACALDHFFDVSGLFSAGRPPCRPVAGSLAGTAVAEYLARLWVADSCNPWRLRSAAGWTDSCPALWAHDAMLARPVCALGQALEGADLDRRFHP